MKLILASGSPRRKQILQQHHFDFEVITSEIDETFDPKLSIEEGVKKLAYLKASNVYHQLEDPQNYLVLGSDTIVVIDNQILGKPKDQDEAIEMLSKLQGRSHLVMTGCCLIGDNICDSFVGITKVTIDPMTIDQIKTYLTEEDVYDKAGSYAIQGPMKRYISHLDGELENVIGLPIKEVSKKLKGWLK